ncbi:MAG: hydrogenase maturation nickel metallochaperone HypA [Bacteroidia bacterium]|nr:hydrogenase maturation nickel metallochaperone HypA [Bacteroidia bacterium]
MSIVDIAQQSCDKEQKNSVIEIGLEIGELAGVEMDALEFIWPVAVKGTVLENAKKTIDRPDGKARCMECEQLYPIHNHYDNCPECKSYFKEIISGQELRVSYLEV